MSRNRWDQKGETGGWIMVFRMTGRFYADIRRTPMKQSSDGPVQQGNVLEDGGGRQEGGRPAGRSGCRAVLKSRNMFCRAVQRHLNPGIDRACRTETDARKEDSVIFVLISRTNFSRNFVRDCSATFRDFSAMNLQLNPGNRLITNKRYSGI
jgi:hypothetical protein